MGPEVYLTEWTGVLEKLPLSSASHKIHRHTVLPSDQFLFYLPLFAYISQVVAALQIIRIMFFMQFLHQVILLQAPPTSSSLI